MHYITQLLQSIYRLEFRAFKEDFMEERVWGWALKNRKQPWEAVPSRGKGNCLSDGLEVKKEAGCRWQKVNPWRPQIPTSCRTVTSAKTSITVEKRPSFIPTHPEESCVPGFPENIWMFLLLWSHAHLSFNKFHPRIWGDIRSSESPGDPDEAIPKREERMN